VTQCTAAAEDSDHHDNDTDCNKYVSGYGLVTEVRRVIQELTKRSVGVLLTEDAVRIDQHPYPDHYDCTSQQLHRHHTIQTTVEGGRRSIFTISMVTAFDAML